MLFAFQGCISWYIPRDGLIMIKWAWTASSRYEFLGCKSPLNLKITLSPQDVPRDISWVSGNLSAVGDGFLPSLDGGRILLVKTIISDQASLEEGVRGLEALASSREKETRRRQARPQVTRYWIKICVADNDKSLDLEKFSKRNDSDFSLSLARG